MKVTIGACGRCGKEFKVKQEAAKPLMRLTCGCGWSGNVGYQNCEICGSKIPVEGGALPPRLCSDGCREIKRNRQHQLDEELKKMRETASQPRFRPGSLPPHWPELSDSSNFWGPLQSPTLRPVMRRPYLASLTVSPDQRSIAWLSPHQEKGMEIVAMDPQTCRLTSSLPYHGELRFPPSVRPSCLFMDDDKLLAIVDTARYATHGSDEVLLVAYNASSGLKIAEATVAKCDFSRPILHPGPRFGPDNDLYAIFLDGLHRRHGEEWIRIGPGSHCMHFENAGKVFCGGGFEDFSAPSMLYSNGMVNREVEAFPWGFIPVHQIEPAGNDDLLIANMAADNRETTGRWAFLSHFNVSDRRSEWAVRLESLARWQPPILLSVPEEKWALINAGTTIDRISLPDGKLMESILGDPLESFEARWLHGSRILCLARARAGGDPGWLEFYEIPLAPIS